MTVKVLSVKRERLPNHRDSIAAEIKWHRDRPAVLFRAGLSHDGRILELFIHIPPSATTEKSGKIGSDIEGIQQDCAVLISLCLQHGITVDQIHRTLGRQSDGGPASIAGAALDWLTGIEGELALQRAEAVGA